MDTLPKHIRFEIFDYLDPYSLFQFSCCNSFYQKELKSQYSSILNCFQSDSYEPLHLFIQSVFQFSNKKRYQVIHECLSKPYYFLFQWILCIHRHQFYFEEEDKFGIDILDILKYKRLIFHIHSFYDSIESMKILHYNMYQEIQVGTTMTDAITIQYQCIQGTKWNNKYTISIDFSKFDTTYLEWMMKSIHEIQTQKKTFPFDLYSRGQKLNLQYEFREREHSYCPILKVKLNRWDNCSLRSLLKKMKQLYSQKQYPFVMNNIELIT